MHYAVLSLNLDSEITAGGRLAGTGSERARGRAQQPEWNQRREMLLGWQEEPRCAQGRARSGQRKIQLRNLG